MLCNILSIIFQVLLKRIVAFTMFPQKQKMQKITFILFEILILFIKNEAC